MMGMGTEALPTSEMMGWEGFQRWIWQDLLDGLLPKVACFTKRVVRPPAMDLCLQIRDRHTQIRTSRRRP